jgi:hypothetical protein
MSKFKPGQSGNPGGRPKGFAEVRELAREHTVAAIGKLVSIPSGLDLRLLFLVPSDAVQWVRIEKMVLVVQG